MAAEAPRLTPQGNPSRAAYFREYRRRKRLGLETISKAAAKAPEVVMPDQSPPKVHDIVHWIEGALRVPTGPLTGRPFRVDRWQSDWLTGALAETCREAGMSVARKNGKSGFIAPVILAGLCGPLNRPGYRMVVTSLTGLLAKELREAVLGTAKASGLMGEINVKLSPPPGVIHGRHGSRCDFLAADKATGHAIGADLALIDEAGLLEEAARPLWNALYSSISGRNGKFWCISIQGHGPLFAELEARADSPTVHWKRFSAPEDADIFDPEAWRAANPGLESGIKSWDYMRDTAARAKGSPGNETHFRAYDLNMNVDPSKETIVSVSQYRECLGAPGEIRGDLVVAWDFGGSASMTCAAVHAPETGGLKVFGAFPADPPLSERARRDRMGTLYDRMVKEGELRVFPGRVTPVLPFVKQVMEWAGERGQVIIMGTDRYRRNEAEQAFADAGIPGHVPVKWRGQGASAKADGTHDVRAFQRGIIGKRLRLAESTMLEAAIASSVIRYDNAGNPALDKSGANARIDALSASVIAVGIGSLIRESGPRLRLSVV